MRPSVCRTLIGVAVASVAPCLAIACWDTAGQRYGVSPALLYAIAGAESSHNPNAVSPLNRDGTYDIGLMQINSSALPVLARFGIDERQLSDPCTNIAVGAWILSQKFAKHGVSWEGVGAYNAACTRLHGKACQVARSAYAWRVYGQLPFAREDSSASKHALPGSQRGRGHKAAMHGVGGGVVATGWSSAGEPLVMAVRVSP